MESLQKICSGVGQEHLLQFWDRLSEDHKTALSAEIHNIDMKEAVGFFDNVNQAMQNESNTTNNSIDEHMEPLETSVCGSSARCSPEEISNYRNLGLDAVSRSEVAVLLLAGGQGTRLGVSYPKGMYNVGLPSAKPLYQLQAERVLKLQSLAKEMSGKSCQVPWYIMTSEHTKDATESFFNKHEYFGLNKDNVVIFEQSLLPCFGFDGKIIMASQHKIALAPAGNGGLYSALNKSGVLEDLLKRGIKYVHVYCVDNILVKMADPVFVGFCLSKNVECGAKVVEKTQPKEAVGVVCKVNGVYQVVEYSEITLSTAEKRTEDGRLMFNAGNICNHFFTVDFLKKVCLKENETQLKHHVAKKKIPFADEDGNIQKPSAPNGIKMEKFVFDVFVFAKTSTFGVWEVLREEEFSPLKNADGQPKDTPTTCRHALMSLHHKRVVAAGGMFVHPDGTPYPHIQSGENGNCANGVHRQQSNEEEDTIVCELSPLVSYDGEGLDTVVKGQKFTPPVQFEMSPNQQVIVKQNQ